MHGFRGCNAFDRRQVLDRGDAARRDALAQSHVSHRCMCAILDGAEYMCRLQSNGRVCATAIYSCM